MTMMDPFLPDPDPARSGADAPAAADPGADAPPSAEGFGPEGEVPDVGGEPGADGPAVRPHDTPFRTPDPGA